MFKLPLQFEHTKEGLTMNQKWSEKTTFQKAMDIIAGIAFLVYLIFHALERAGKVVSADLITSIAILVVCICEAVSFWNTKRVFSYIAIGGGFLLATVLALLYLL
jgi:hypothetical protein